MIARAPATDLATPVTGLDVGPTTPYYVEFMTPMSRRIAEILMEYVLCFAISLTGIATNILVMIVYSKQGFRESVSISMTTIAFWDLAKCTAGALQRTNGLISIWSHTAMVSWSNISLASFNGFICFSSYVTSVMAAYVAVERCLCVSIPLKVKWLITPRVTLTSSLVISVVVFGCFAVHFAVYDIVWLHDDVLNATIAVTKHSKFYHQHEGPFFAYYNLSGILWPLASFTVIVIATIIIVYKLRQGSKFRASQGAVGVTSRQGDDRAAAQTTSRANETSFTSQAPDGESKQDVNTNQPKPKQSKKLQQQQQQLSGRDRQVVKMLLVIIAVYIANLFPRISLYLAKYIVYDFYFLRRYHGLFVFVCHWLWLVDLLNGAVNFFIFYAMSSSFRSTFQEIFCAGSSTSIKNEV